MKVWKIYSFHNIKSSTALVLDISLFKYELNLYQKNII